MIQAFFNTDGTSLTAVITVLGSDGAHVDPDSWPITNDPAIVLSSHPAAAKTVTKIDVGVYQVVWSGLSPALTHGQVVYIAVDGAIATTAWTTWQIPIQVIHLPAKPSDVPSAAANATQVRTELATELARIDVDVSSRLSTAGYTSPDNASIAAILVDTDELQTNQGNWVTADVSGLALQSTLLTVAGYVDTEISAIKTVTDKLDTALEVDGAAGYQFTILALENAPSGSGASASAIADAVWDELQSGHTTPGSFGAYLDAAVSGVSTGGVSVGAIADAVWDEARAGHATAGTFGEVLDVAVSTRLASAGYTAPDNASIAAILADTDELQLNQGNWLTASGFSTLDAAGVRAAIGLAAANLDAQIGDIPTVAEFAARTIPSDDYFVAEDYLAPDNAAIAAIQAEIGKVPRAAAALAAGAFTMTITAGQAAEVTYSSPV